MNRFTVWLFRAVLLVTSLVSVTACAVYEPAPAPGYAYAPAPGYYAYPSVGVYYGGYYHERWH